MKEGRLPAAISLGANAAVLVGLIFLAIQVRGERAAAEAELVAGVADGFVALNLAGITDPQVACIWIVGLERPENLTAVESAQFSLYLRGIFNQYQRVYRQHLTGLVPLEQWHRTAQEAAWLRSTAGGRAYFAENDLPADFDAALAPFEGVVEHKGMSLGKTPPDTCQ